MLFSAFVLGSLASRAEAITVLYKKSPVLNSLRIHLWGNNDPFPSCDNTQGTGLLPVSIFYTTMNAVTTPWLAPASSGTNIAGFNLDVDMGGGVHHGLPIDICGLAAGIYPLTIGTYSIMMTVSVSGSVYTFDFN